MSAAAFRDSAASAHTVPATMGAGAHDAGMYLDGEQ